MQCLEGHEQDIQRFREQYTIIGKNKVSDLGITDRCPTITLIYDFAQYPVHASVEE